MPHLLFILVKYDDWQLESLNHGFSRTALLIYSCLEHPLWHLNVPKVYVWTYQLAKTVSLSYKTLQSSRPSELILQAGERAYPPYRDGWAFLIVGDVGNRMVLYII